MRRGLILALAAGLLAGAPAFAQDETQTPASNGTPVLTDAEINVAAEMYREQVEMMTVEVSAAVRAAGSNRRRALARAEDVMTRYQPGFERFAVQLEAWFNQRAAAATTGEARASVLQTGAASVARVRGVAEQLRARLAQQAPAPVVPEQPRNTPPSTGY